MAVDWKLKEVLFAHGIYNARQLSKELEAKVGVRISSQSLRKQMNKPPEKLRIETVQYLCTLLQVSLSGFLTVTPEEIWLKEEGSDQDVVKPYSLKEDKGTRVFSDPRKYFSS